MLPRPVIVTLPIYNHDTLEGVIDLVARRRITWDGEGPSKPILEAVQLSDNQQALRDRLLEACADEDPSILEAVVEGRDVAPDVLWAALRRATISRRVVPVFAGSAYRHRGVEPLLDGVVTLLPSPRDRGAVHGVGPASSVANVGEGESREPSSKEPLAALGFKVVFDEHGQMTFVRVYSGVLEKGATVLAVRAGRKLRVGRIVQLVGKTREEVSRLEAGEIGAVVALPLGNGETLSAVERPIALEAITAPDAVVRVAVEAKTSADREKLGLALSRMVAQDPSLRIESDGETGQTLLAGMGQLHLEITIERLALEHGVSVTTGKPLVAYRSTLRKQVRTEYRHVKQSGGPGQWAHVVLEVGPAERGAGFVFEDRIKGGAIPREFVRGVEAGVREALGIGLLGGHPVVDVRVAVVDGMTHPNDSSELAFHVAGSMAFRQAAAEAEPCLLEPVMTLEVSCPEVEVGSVVGDLGRRRAQVLGIDARGEDRAVRASVPLSEMFGYAGSLGGLTHGRGRFTLEPKSYEPVPDAVAKVIAAQS